jgi:LAGLIDADG-like domain
MYYRIRFLELAKRCISLFMPVRFSTEQEKEMVCLYKAGSSPTQIAALLKTYNSSIRRVLLRNGIEPQGSSERNRLVKENPFANLDCMTTQYWLGYIATDGCIKQPSGTINISTNQDPQHLEHYVKFTGYPLKIQKYLNKKYQVWEYSVNFNNPIVKDYLINLGITPQKSLTLKLNMPLTWSFVRGYFDGNGSVLYKSEANVNASICTGSEAFAQQLVSFLKQQNISATVVTTGSKAILIQLYKNDRVQLFYKGLYTNAEIFLERKKVKFGSAMEKSLV